jgi:hypothetical protein
MYPRQGKPVVRRGRKAVDPTSVLLTLGGCLVTEWMSKPSRRADLCNKNVLNGFIVHTRSGRIDRPCQPFECRFRFGDQSRTALYQYTEGTLILLAVGTLREAHRSESSAHQAAITIDTQVHISTSEVLVLFQLMLKYYAHTQ